jgi:outer membrane usher protein
MLARPRDRLSDWGAVFVRFVRSFGCGFALLVTGSPYIARAADAQTGTALYLQPVIDGRTVAGILPVVAEADGVRIRITDLERIGISGNAGRPDGNDYRFLPVAGRLSAVVDDSSQTIALNIPFDFLLPNIASISPSGPIPRPAPPAVGAYLNYSLTGSSALSFRTGQRDVRLFGNLDSVFFSPWGALSSQTAVQAPPGNASDQPAVARLATTYEIDNPFIPRAIRLGDVVTVPPGWARSNLMGGLQIATDYALQPSVITFPTPQIGSNLTVPSTVSLLVNNAAAYKTNLDAGPFSLVGIPVLTGLNQLTVQTRNASGQVTSQTVPFYASPTMLKAGLTTYAATVGYLRRNYGTLRDGYRIASTDDTISHGITDNLTGTLHLEASPRLGLVGGSLETAGLLGDITGSLAASTFRGAAGVLASANYTRSSQVLSLAGGVTVASPTYNDLAAENGAPFPRLNWYVSSGIALPRGLGTVNLAYNTQDGAVETPGITRINEDSRFLLASYDLQFHEDWSLSVSAFIGRITASHKTTNSDGFALSLNFPLGGAVRGGTSFNAGSGADPQYGQLLSALPSSRYGYGGQVQNEIGNEGSTYGNFVANTNLVDLSATVSRFQGQQAEQFQANGSVAMLDGVHFSSPLQSAFAVVDVGYPNVPVSLSNQIVGTTGPARTVFVPGLLPNYPNLVSVDPNDLPMTVTFRNSAFTVVPPLYGGVVVHFASKPVSDVLVRISEPDGKQPAPGSLIYLSGAARPKTVVGYDGEAMITDPPHRLEGYVLSANGKCKLSAILTTSLSNYLKGEPISCIPLNTP